MNEISLEAYYNLLSNYNKTNLKCWLVGTVIAIFFGWQANDCASYIGWFLVKSDSVKYCTIASTCLALSSLQIALLFRSKSKLQDLLDLLATKQLLNAEARNILGISEKQINHIYLFDVFIFSASIIILMLVATQT